MSDKPSNKGFSLPGQDSPSETGAQHQPAVSEVQTKPVTTLKEGKVNMSINSLASLIGMSSLVSQAGTIPEVKAIAKGIDDAVADLKRQIATPEQMATLPADVTHLTSDITQHLPGIVLPLRLGQTVYVMPILFWKAGVTDATDTIMVNQGEAPRGFAKTASSFMHIDMINKIRDSFAFYGEKKADEVMATSPCVINLEHWIKEGKNTEEMVREVVNVILTEWHAGLMTLGVMLTTKAGGAIPSPFKNSKLFGDQDTAIARVEAAYNPVIRGVTTGYNLAVNISTAPKNAHMVHTNNMNAKSVCKTFLNVQLDTMQPQQYGHLRQRAGMGQNVGPIVPVISIGQTIPGETLNHNQSILSAALGLFAALTANNLRFYSEAIRAKEVGHRGNLAVFNNYLSAITQGQYTSDQLLSAKNISNVAVVNDWIQRFVNSRAVYVVDVPTFGPDSSISDFWMGMAKFGPGSLYQNTLIAIFDALTNKKFSEKAEENAKMAQRDPSKHWTKADKVLSLTQMIVPRGRAQGKDGKWFCLSEIDGMFLRQTEYLGTNEVEIAEYQALVQGSVPGVDRRTREFNLINKLQHMFQGNVIIDGFDARLIWSSALFNTLAEAMVSTGTLTVNSSAHQSNWTMEYSNELFDHFMTAGIVPQVGGGASAAQFGMYSNLV
ncbi:hypothetical protein D6_0044 [Aeromonas phage D6]|uniref:Uncharacterized protein n=2 Tax=Ludhianavirus TaxID=3044751 RepID=A0A514A187_9CAUD|nr:nuclear shell protein [Aeromonas phage LAh10]YP_010668792.1 nuclear shell protein [Aeromonas phage D6]QDH47031.1 hypothetical protein LAh10_211 [Aeromonas phage LAh10]QDJ97204.1 hypothetical protein D6_0044 [Aeromonas phage D6]